MELIKNLIHVGIPILFFALPGVAVIQWDVRNVIELSAAFMFTRPS